MISAVTKRSILRSGAVDASACQAVRQLPTFASLRRGKRDQGAETSF